MEFHDNSQVRFDPRPDLAAAFARLCRSPVPGIGLRAGDPVPLIVLKDADGRRDHSQMFAVAVAECLTKLSLKGVFP